MAQLDQEGCHIFRYSFVCTEDLHVELSQMPLVSLKRHHEFLIKD